MSRSIWAIAVLASRETSATLCATVDALVVAAADHPATIDVVVNGNRALATQMQTALSRHGTARVRLWFVAMGDKSHAWNTYLHTIAPAADVVYFVDGYAAVDPASLRAIDEGLRAHPEAWAASGVPTRGRSAAKLRQRLLSEGGIHGNLYALRGTTAELFRTRDFRFPLGMYRNDPLLNAVVAFALDPATHEWDRHRMLVVDGATWDFEQLPWFRWSSLKTQWKRIQRQAQGDLENAAVRQHLAIAQRSPTALPRTAAELVAGWIAAEPAAAARLTRGARHRRAVRNLLAPRDWSATAVAPELLRTIE